MGNAIAARDGTVDFSGGVDSIAVRTLTSANVPGGLKRNQLAWMNNCGVRDGGIQQRAGWLYRSTVSANTGLFQGKMVYSPIGANPYELWAISGSILKVELESPYTVTNLTALFPGTEMPATGTYFHFVQAEQFAIIQAGDGTTLPLFWDGTTLRRSNGLTGNIANPGLTVREFTVTDFFMIPGVGGTVTVELSAQYPGAAPETGVLRGSGGAFDIGTFTVTAFTIVAPFTVDLQTVSSAYIGNNFPPFDYVLTLDTVPPAVAINEIPAATAMDYFMGRVWYAQDRVVSAGDIVRNYDSGTAAYNYTDSVLKVTENPLAIEGDGFPLPSQDGNTIRGIAHSANIDAALGQGRLFVGTRKAIYALNVPVTRTDWVAANNATQPLITIVQLSNGWVNDRCIVSVNGDLFFQSLEPGIRSLVQSTRYFEQWGNVEISSNENRVLQFNDRSLLRFATGIFFDNRLLQSALPRETLQGVVHDAIIPMDVVPISSFLQNRPANWEGVWQGVPIFQMSVADFGGLERAFAAVRSETDNSIQLWELTDSSRVEFVDNRIEWNFETPAWTWAESIGELEKKEVVSLEMWVDRLWGTVNFLVEYRPDGASCWIEWQRWEECSPRNTVESTGVPDGYPVNMTECYKMTMTLPHPPETCAPCGIGRPAYQLYQCQVRVTIKGYCRVRGIWLWAKPMERKLHENLVCATSPNLIA